MLRLSSTVATATLLTLAAAGTSGWQLPEWARGGKMWRDISSRYEVGNSTVNIFDQLIDHLQPGGPTFKQRYYVDNTYYNPSAAQPKCFIYVGEYSAAAICAVRRITRHNYVDAYV